MFAILPKISAARMDSIYLPEMNEPKDYERNKLVLANLMSELSDIGFVLSGEAINILTEYEITKEFYDSVIVSIGHMIGSDVEYKPMYPNFPEQVRNASDVELFINAIVHYLSNGELLPLYETDPRQSLTVSDRQRRVLNVVVHEDMMRYFNKLLASKDSVTPLDMEFIKFAISREWYIGVEIGFKEILCEVGVHMLVNGQDISSVCKTATDILRVMVAYSEGDTTLSKNHLVKFKSLKRSMRRNIVNALNLCINDEDISRHYDLWKRAFHNLHIGEYKGKASVVAKKFRDNNNVLTYMSKVEMSIGKGKTYQAADLLLKRPSEFARRLDKLVRDSKQPSRIIKDFVGVIGGVNTKILLQLLGHIKRRSRDISERVVFPKGEMSKMLKAEGLPALDKNVVVKIVDAISSELINRFRKMPSLGKVWIDPALRDCPLPTGMRTVPDGFKVVPRGTKLKIEGDPKVVRLFTYWKDGSDLDLSASFFSDEFGFVNYISYYDYRGYVNNYSIFSGDIINGENGAAEFIDIDIDRALSCNVRYVVMDVRNFSRTDFTDMDRAFCGVMTRDKFGVIDELSSRRGAECGEIYEASTVDARIDLTGNSDNIVPFIFDLKECKLIWIGIHGDCEDFVNAISENIESQKQNMESFINNDSKLSLYDLMKLHAVARGESIVNSKDDADFTVGVSDCNLTIYDFAEINSNYM